MPRWTRTAFVYFDASCRRYNFYEDTFAADTADIAYPHYRDHINSAILHLVTYTMHETWRCAFACACHCGVARVEKSEWVTASRDLPIPLSQVMEKQALYMMFVILRLRVAFLIWSYPLGSPKTFRVARAEASFGIYTAGSV